MAFERKVRRYGILFLVLSRGPPGPLDPADKVVEDESKVAPEDTVFP